MSSKLERQRLQGYRAQLRRRMAACISEAATALAAEDEAPVDALLAAERLREHVRGMEPAMQALAEECEELATAPTRPTTKRRRRRDT